MTLSILYRGDLSSCNYDCPYCPFAKRKDSRASLAADRRQLLRFVDFIKNQKSITFKILFTPWGEALIRNYYQKALVALSLMENVEKVAIQTNLSCPTGWLEEADKGKLALWATYHPGQTTRARFLSKCQTLDAMGVAYSVGIVGFKETIAEIEAFRAQLPKERYVWINAAKETDNYYTTTEADKLMAVDPFFHYNMIDHDSEGKACKTGHSVISVDGEGNIKRCHFIKNIIGNIYDKYFLQSLFPRNCTNKTCGCHIGYVHMDDLQMYDIYKGKELERIVG